MKKSVVKQKIDLIAECVFSKTLYKIEEDFGLYSGQFGILLFLLYYSRYTQNEKHIILTENYAEKLLQHFVKKREIHTFCSGISGILYLFEFLREKDIIDFDISKVQSILENSIIYNMRLDMHRSQYDFMHAALGVGFYFLKRKTNTEYIQELVDFLYLIAEKDFKNKIFKWMSVIDHERKIVGYNLALSHGISSIVIFLVRCVRNGLINDKIMEMLTGAVNFVLSNQMDFTQYGSSFPSYVFKDLPKSISKSRLGWCYGDLGTGIALWQAGKASGQTEWGKRGIEALIHSTYRRNLNETMINDAGICHGSAGVAMIFRRMFLETGHYEFENAIQFWIKQTLDFSMFEDGLVGYKTLIKQEWECDYSLLTGISGIGLMLLTYLSEIPFDWDELFLLK